MTVKTSTHNVLSTWFLDSGRSFIEKYSNDRLAAFDSDFDRLQKLEALAKQELTICFLGTSGVGKSTLINVLVADGRQVLPQGGVGPLTAQATIVRHSEDQCLRAKYLAAKHFNRMLFALERWHEAELKRAGQEAIFEASELAAETLDEDDRLEVETAIPIEPTDSAEEVSSGASKIDSYTKRVSLLIGGDQFKIQDKPYLIDSLRECLGKERLLGTVVEPSDSERIKRLQEVIARARDREHVFEFKAGKDPVAFFNTLREHASGFLAPAISTLEVLVDAPCLENRLVFVDLPGLGVANDDYQSVTNTWIREAKAVVLVVDRSGIAESSAQLLQSTGYLTSLLHDSHDLEALRKQLIVAVVKIDTSADDARAQDKSFPPPEGVRRWVEYFDDACRESTRTVTEQLKVELKKIHEDGGDATRTERQQVMDDVLGTLDVHPVSAIDYRKFVIDDEDEPPRIKNGEASRVPQLRDALVGIGNENTQRLREGLESATDDVREKARTAIRLTLAKWEQDERAQEEAEKLRAELERFIKPLEKEFHHRQGEFRNHLEFVIPSVISNSVNETAMSALRDIEKYLKKLRGVHWATLRAAVRRNGTFVGAKKVDLPVDITLRFEGPIAVAWSKDVLASIRRRTRNMGKEQTLLVGKIAGWARGEGTRVKPDLVEALHSDLNAQTKELGNVGKEAIDELKERVRQELYKEVEVCVRRNCQKFVRRKQDVGVGVKNRMHDFLREELSHAVIDAAKPVALEVLKRNYAVVAEEVRERFREQQNPIDAAVDAIVSAEEQFVRRSDAQRRKGVIREANEHLVRLEALGAQQTNDGGAA